MVTRRTFAAKAQVDGKRLWAAATWAALFIGVGTGTLQSAPAVLAAGAAAPFEYRYPAGATIDVKALGAKGDGVTDDTQAMQAALRKAIDHLDRYSEFPIVYLPKGTYLVSAPLVARLDSTTWSKGWRAGLWMCGESRDGSIIRLKDRTAAFQDAAAPKALLATGSENPNSPAGTGNQAFRHQIQNLTLDVGTGNPGAVGLDYLSHNRGMVEDVIIRSSDPAGIGRTGLYIGRAWPGPALIKRVTVEGFNTGVEVRHYEYSMTFEHLTLRGQRVAGFTNTDNAVFIRGLVSENSVPAVVMTGDNGHINLYDAKLTGGHKDSAAVVNKGKLLLRGIRVQGYGKAVLDRTGASKSVTAAVAGDTVAEYISHAAASLFPSPAGTLRLPVEETPEFHTNDAAQWAIATAYGAIPGDGKDDRAALQAAIDAGRAQVILPRGKYHIAAPLVVRGNVAKIAGLHASISKVKDGFQGEALIRFEGGTRAAVVLECLALFGAVEHASPKALALRHVDHGGVYNSAAGTGKLFLEDVIGRDYVIRAPLKVWARQLNAEFGHKPLFQNEGGTVWILGMKTEDPLTVIKNTRGTVELMGGLFYPLRDAPDTIPLIINDEGSVSLSYAVSGQKYPVQVKERRNGVWKSLLRNQVPYRGHGANVTLYTGYVEGTVGLRQAGADGDIEASDRAGGEAEEVIREGRAGRPLWRSLKGWRDLLGRLAP